MDDVRLYSIALIIIVLSIILLLILLNCCLNKVDKALVVHDTQYFDNILLLLERQEAVERSKAERMKLYATTDLFLRTPRQSKPIFKANNTNSTFPRRQRSVSVNQTNKLNKLKQDLEYFKVDHGVHIRHPTVSPDKKPILRLSSSAPVQRRTWGKFDAQFQDLLDASEEKENLLGMTSDESKLPKAIDFTQIQPSWIGNQGMETTV